MAVFERSVTTDWEGGLMDGNGVAKAGTRSIFAAGDVSEPHRRAGGQDQPRRVDGGGACRVLRDGDERRAGRRRAAKAARRT